MGFGKHENGLSKMLFLIVGLSKIQSQLPLHKTAQWRVPNNDMQAGMFNKEISSHKYINENTSSPNNDNWSTESKYVPN